MSDNVVPLRNEPPEAGAVSGLHVRLLTRNEVPDAQALLYRVFCACGDWLPIDGNPTGLRIEEDGDGSWL